MPAPETLLACESPFSTFRLTPLARAAPVPARASGRITASRRMMLLCVFMSISPPVSLLLCAANRQPVGAGLAALVVPRQQHRVGAVLCHLDRLLADRRAALAGDQRAGG